MANDLAVTVNTGQEDTVQASSNPHAGVVGLGSDFKITATLNGDDGMTIGTPSAVAVVMKPFIDPSISTTGTLANPTIITVADTDQSTWVTAPQRVQAYCTATVSGEIFQGNFTFDLTPSGP